MIIRDVSRNLCVSECDARPIVERFPLPPFSLVLAFHLVLGKFYMSIYHAWNLHRRLLSMITWESAHLIERSYALTMCFGFIFVLDVTRSVGLFYNVGTLL